MTALAVKTERRLTKESFMFRLPAAPDRAAMVRGFGLAGGILTVGALSVLAARPAAGETAGDVLKKMADLYSKAKSYQVSVTTIQAGKDPKGKAFKVTQTEQIQYQSPNRIHKSVRAAGSGPAITGAFAQAITAKQGEIFSDGKTATMYVASKKMYQKQPAPPQVLIPQIVDLLRLVPGANRPGLTLLPNTANVKGRQAYVIQVEPTPPPPTLKPDELKKYKEGLKQWKQFPRFMIDKQNYNLLEYTLQTAGGTATIDLTSQVFGGAIPARTFAFAPPPGAKEFKPKPPPTGPAGIPGHGLPQTGGAAPNKPK